ncbi:hypothetical protein Q7A_1124 [Methylophaga nitratireducenticrescens]|uniref:DnrO protein n=1 Tax=Methylophaga nitratireducenticrescens TaxID=754476 RepID=I1XHU3_METNJ|nr:hypothetical protein [Methylophaga nitratireducenticrescens]AFI83962.1 hypothetical protein Q7A_1124 [Methylophaga nitratireducenticrescens]
MKNKLITVLITSCLMSGVVLAGDNAHSNHNKAMTSELSLNNGDRWEMDDHTRKMASKMEETFLGADHSTLASLNAVGAQLEAQLDVLIEGCTMEGKAHEQLHIFLTDYIPTVHNLAKAEDHETAKNSAIKIKGELEAYKKHFK